MSTGENYYLDSIHAMEERTAAWRILTAVMREEDLLGKIIEPFKDGCDQ